MTRQHFQFIADVLKAQLEFAEIRPYVLALAEEFADRVEDTNPNFDRDRFIKACTS